MKTVLRRYACVVVLGAAMTLVACGSDSQDAEPGAVASTTEPADFVFTNARVYTVNPDQPWADALAEYLAIRRAR